MMSNRYTGSALPGTSHDVQQANGKRFATDVIRCPEGKEWAKRLARCSLHGNSNEQKASQKQGHQTGMVSPRGGLSQQVVADHGLTLRHTSNELH